MNVFISGGCKNGKSTFAQNIAVKLADGGSLYYIATMIPHDDEDRERIRRHLENRAGMGFETLEAGRDIISALNHADKSGTFLLDSVTALLLNGMFPSSHSGEADPDAGERCKNELIYLIDNVKNAVFVSDYIYSDAARYDEFTENYRRTLAMLDRCLAGLCDVVIELCSGNTVVHKGVLPQ